MNTKTKKLKRRLTIYKIVFGLVVGIVVTLSIYSHKQSADSIETVTDSLRSYKDKYARAVAEKRMLSLNASQIQDVVDNNDSLKAMIKNLKNRQVSEVIQIKTRIQYDTIPIFAEADTTITKKDTVKSDSVFLFNHNKKHLTLNGEFRLSDKRLSINQLSIPNSQDIIVHRNTKAFEDKYSYKINVTNSNPYITTNSIESYKLNVEKKWYEKWYIVAPSAFLAGAVIVGL